MTKKKYYVDYGLTSGNFDFFGTLDRAKRLADIGVKYTQKNYFILEEGEDGSLRQVAFRAWHEAADLKEMCLPKNAIVLGDRGYYSDWENI